jgi:fucose permease
MRETRERPPQAVAHRLALALSYAGFISLGLPDTVLGAAWPALRGELGLPLGAAGAALLLTTAGVLLSSIASGWLRARMGTGRVLIVSTLLAALALWLTALAPSWSYVLCAAFVAGLGGGAIDATLNDYVARHYGARHMSWLHACWGVGATAAPLMVASSMAAGRSWRFAYGALAALEASLVLSFALTRKHWEAAPTTVRELHAAASSDVALRAGSAPASVLAFFCYGGLEASAGLWAASLLVETRAASQPAAGAAVASYWAALCVGRFVWGAAAERVGPARVLRVSVRSALLALVALTLPALPTWSVTLALVVLGLSLAPIYPLAMHDTAQRFGRELGARLVGYQVAAASFGVATLPWLIGTLVSTRLALLPPLLALLGVGLVILERARR